MTQVTVADLERTYAEKTDEELLSLHRRGTLTETAYGVLEAELSKRGVPVPPRPQTIEPFPKPMSREERIEGFKTLTIMGSILPVGGVAGPITNTYCSGLWVLLAVIIVLALAALFTYGVTVLSYPEVRKERPRAVRLGGLTAALLLVMAPKSISLGLANLSSHPKWLPFSLIGTAAAIAYLLFAYRHWRSSKSVA